MSNFFASLFDYEEYVSDYEDIEGLWETGFSENRYRNVSKFTILDDLRCVTAEQLLTRIMKIMPCVIDIPGDEFPALPAIEDVSDDTFWSWTGFYSYKLDTYIFAFEDEKDAIKFKFFCSCLNQEA